MECERSMVKARINFLHLTSNKFPMMKNKTRISFKKMLLSLSSKVWKI